MECIFVKFTAAHIRKSIVIPINKKEWKFLTEDFIILLGSFCYIELFSLIKNISSDKKKKNKTKPSYKIWFFFSWIRREMSARWKVLIKKWKKIIDKSTLLYFLGLSFSIAYKQSWTTTGCWKQTLLMLTGPCKIKSLSRKLKENTKPWNVRSQNKCQQ